MVHLKGSRLLYSFHFHAQGVSNVLCPPLCWSTSLFFMTELPIVITQSVVLVLTFTSSVPRNDLLDLGVPPLELSFIFDSQKLLGMINVAVTPCFALSSATF
ncbi:hypothetical protein BsWGS_14247 [Bradybaena similaris]